MLNNVLKTILKQMTGEDPLPDIKVPPDMGIILLRLKRDFKKSKQRSIDEFIKTTDRLIYFIIIYCYNSRDFPKWVTQEYYNKLLLHQTYYALCSPRLYRYGVRMKFLNENAIVDCLLKRDPAFNTKFFNRFQNIEKPTLHRLLKISETNPELDRYRLDFLEIREYLKYEK